MVKAAAYSFIVLTAGVVLFQLALVAGMPWGEAAWGGAYPGVLPPAMRFASAASALLLTQLGAVIALRARLRGNPSRTMIKKAAWGVVAFCVLSVMLNAITPSVIERVIWLPVTLAMLVSSVVVARA